MRRKILIFIILIGSLGINTLFAKDSNINANIDHKRKFENLLKNKIDKYENSGEIKIKNMNENNAEKNHKLILTVLDVMKLAYENNADLSIARAHIDTTLKDIEIAKKQFGWQLNLEVSAIGGDQPSLSLGKWADGRKFTPSKMMGLFALMSEPPTDTFYETAFSIGYPLYYAGLKRLSKKLATLQHRQSKEDFEAYANQIVAAAISLFYNLQTAIDQVKTNEQMLKTVNAQLNDVKIMYEGGSVLRSDYLAMKVRVKEIQLRLVKAKNMYDIAKTMLLNFIGVDPDTDIELKKSEFNVEELPENFNKALKIAYKNRYELKSADLMIKMAKTGIKMAKTGHKPKVMMFGKYSFNDDNFTLSSDQDAFMAGIKLDLNIFDNNLTKSKVKKAMAQLEEAKKFYNKVKNDIKLDVRKAFENLLSAEKALKVSESNLKFAEENLRLMKRQYDGGSVTITAYLNAEQALSNARLMYIASKNQLIMAKTDLMRSIGKCLLCLYNALEK